MLCNPSWQKARLFSLAECHTGDYKCCVLTGSVILCEIIGITFVENIGIFYPKTIQIYLVRQLLYQI